MKAPWSLPFFRLNSPSSPSLISSSSSSPAQPHIQGLCAPSPPRKEHLRAALQTLQHPKPSAGSAWEPGLPRGRRSPVPPQNSALEHNPPSQCMTSAAPFPKAQPFPQGHQDLSNWPPTITSLLVLHPQALASNSRGAQSHGAADFICIYRLLTTSMPKATIASIGSQGGNVEADVAPALPHATLSTGVTCLELLGRKHQVL